MKILYVTTVGGTMRFFRSFISELTYTGHTVEIAANTDLSDVPELYKQLGCRIYKVSTSRSPFSFGNFKAIGQIRSIVKAGHYDIVHCHTPLAAMATRLACRKLRKKGLRVIYTAHGFHFYKGAPLKNWLLYYPVEKICSRFTDVLVTINKEDHEFAQKKLRSPRIVYVPGVGIDVKRFSDAEVDREEKRKQLGVPADAKLILSVGELNENKNHRLVIRALARLNDERIHYAIAGKGEKKEELEALAKSLGIGDRLHLLGFRNDVAELYKTADLYVLPSIREGLNVSLMEAMAAGLPCIASKIRGNVDMIPEENCFDPTDETALSKLIAKDTFGVSDFVKQIDVRSINEKMLSLYTVA